MEIERKFLPINNVIDKEGLDFVRIRQSYVSLSPVIRIRKYGEKYKLTVKGKGHMSREEFELDISREEYERLSQKTEGGEIVKTRYFKPIGGGLTAEIDVYEGNLTGLETIEVEFESERKASAFTPPDWFGREITYDKNYTNAALSQKSKTVGRCPTPPLKGQAPLESPSLGAFK